MLQIEEEEQFVLDDWTTNPKARIAPREKRVRVEGAPLQGGVRGHIMIPVEEIGATVKIVTARSRDNVNRSPGCDAGGQIEVHRGHLELLYDFLGKVHRRQIA